MRSVLFCVLGLSLNFGGCFDFPTENSVCSKNQECKQPRDCPQVVKDFKERDIKPKICNFRARSLSVCCDNARTTKPVKNLPDNPVELVCGKRNVRREFQFLLQPRQGDIPSSLTEKPVSLSKELLDQSTLVVGGDEVEENAYPWMAALGSRSNDRMVWFCGGSLINNKMVLTAAHCVKDAGFELDVVRLGAHNLGESEFEDVDDYVPQQVFVHPQYKQGNFPEHDIAIVVLQTEAGGVKQRKEVSPVCLPEPGSRPRAGSSVLIAGWGATSEGGIQADRLQETTVKVTEPSRCRSIYRDLANAELGEDILCAGLQEGGKDACQGDSGGPLVQERDDGSFNLVGVVSTGIGCARRDIPGLYADVEAHLSWIDGVLKL